MDTNVLIWIAVAVVVLVIIILLVVALTSRRRRAERQRVQHDKAEQLRADARKSDLAAREQEAKAAQERAKIASAEAAAQQARAQAAQADVEARRAEGNIGSYERAAQERRSEHEETLQKADDLDPYTNDDDVRRDTSTNADGVPGDRPRSLESTAHDHGEPLTRRDGGEPGPEGGRPRDRT